MLLRWEPVDDTGSCDEFIKDRLSDPEKEVQNSVVSAVQRVSQKRKLYPNFLIKGLKQQNRHADYFVSVFLNGIMF